jgi:cold shock protein
MIMVCASCNTRFVWTGAEQTGAPKPTLCPGCRQLAPQGGRRRGIVKWFNRNKGYGFITPTEGLELFVHKSGLPPGHPFLRPGQLVEFDLVAAPRGSQAEGVVVLETSEPDAFTP